MAPAKIPGVMTPWASRHSTSSVNVRDVAASAVTRLSVNAEPTMTRRRPTESASLPTNGAQQAMTTVGAVIVNPTPNAEASKERASSGSSG